jgi:serine/threonine protein kinase/tetratricopeptide (TPR) repeat protein
LAIIAGIVVGLGQEFGGTSRFAVERRLGEGGFGVVYQVFDRERQERVALKTLQRLDADGLYRFKKEFRLLADVSDPHLVTLHELFSDRGLWFYTMELVRGVEFLAYVMRPGDGGAPDAEGVTQRVEVEPGRCVADEGRLRWAMAELVDGVEALHAAGRLHRDIKPSNVLVSEDGRVVLLDFGLAVETDREMSSKSRVVGTVAYMAPEQARGDELGAAADWYAVGVMLYEALTGRLPHEGRELQVMLAKQTEDPPAPIELVPGAPRDLSDLAMGLLSRDPALRLSGESARRVLGHVQAPSPLGSALAATVWCSDADDTEDPESGGDILLGRHRELQALTEAFQAVSRSKPVVVEMSGRSGMGKTALLRSHLHRLARRSEVVLLSGRCFEQETLPFKAVDSVIDALCRYLLGLDLAAANALMPRDVKALARLFPVLDRVEAVRAAPDRVAEVPDIGELRRRAFGALTELLARIADRWPLVVAIDDVQWGDVDSALLLGKLLTDPEPPGMLLVLCFRSEERERSPFLLELLGGAALPVAIRRIDVEALAGDDAVELARLLLGAGATDERVEAIIAESGRSPLFIHALARYAGRGGAGITFEGVVAGMIGALPPESRRLLEVVAVAGQPVAPAMATHAAGLDAEGKRMLRVLRAARLVRGCGGEADQVECYHDRVREAVVAELDPERRRAHHQALAAALEAFGAGDPEQLAFHLAGAGELERAAEQAGRAADQAADKLAFDRAARLYRTALELGRPSPTRERELRVKLGDALANGGRGAEAADEYLAAAAGLPRLEALELRRRAALELLGSGRYHRGVEVMRDVLAELGMQFARSPRHAFLGIMVQQARQRARGYGFTERAERTLSAEDLLRLDTCWAAAQGFRMTEVTYAMTFASRFLRLALDLGEPYRISLGMSLQATSLVAFSLGPAMRRRSAELLDQAERIARRLDAPRAIAFNLFSAGVVASFSGRWRAALERCDQAIELYRDQCTGVTLEVAQTQQFAMSAMLHLGQLRAISRRFFGLLQEARARGDIFSSVGYLGAYGYTAWLADDDVETTRRELAQARAAWPLESYLLQNWFLDLAETFTELYAGRGRPAWELMQAVLPRFKRTPYWQVSQMRSTTWQALGAAALAAAREASADRSERGRALREAERCARKLDGELFPAARPWSLSLGAGVATARGDADGAVRALAAAAEGFAALDMTMHAAAARRARGGVLGGDEGARLLRSADEELASLGAARPACFAAMVSPGLSE